MTNIALVGTGAFAREHLDALRQVPDVRIAYVVGSDPRHTAEFALAAPGAIATTRLADALEDPRVRAVDICNTTPQHAPAAIAAARAGKHVHVDKPAALHVADLDAMTAAAREAGVSLMVGQTVRFQPIVSRLKAALDRGEIGDPRLLHVTWYTGHVWPQGWRGWQLDVARSGGHPVHNGTHIFDLAVWLMGSAPVEVFTRSFTSWAAQMPMPDSFTSIVRFANGSLATLELSYALRQQGDSLRRMALMGTTGTLLHDTSADPGLSSPAAKAPPASLDGALGHQLTHWLQVVRGEAELVVRHEQARAALATAVAAQESLVSGRAVSIQQALEQEVVPA